MKLTKFNLIKLFLVFCIILNALSKNTKWLKKFCNSESAYNLVNRLIEEKYIKTTCVARVMCSLDRSLFTDDKKMAYDWDPVYIGYGATISSPRVHANALEKALEKFDRNQKIKILDLGSGSGYLTVALSLLFPKAAVIGVEHIKDLVKISINNVNKRHRYLMDSGNLKIYHGDGLKGMKSEAPFDYIHSGANLKHVSYKLFNQIKNGGRFVSPVSSPRDEERQFIWVFDKDRHGYISGRKTIKESYVFMQSTKNQLKKGKSNIYAN